MVEVLRKETTPMDTDRTLRPFNLRVEGTHEADPGLRAVSTDCMSGDVPGCCKYLDTYTAITVGFNKQ